MDCDIVKVGKRRDGGTRYWCVAHHANATAKYGLPAAFCVAAHDAPILPHETLDLAHGDYPGGIALWGSVPAVYDTTTLPADRGVHVHARHRVDGDKDIDATFRRLRVPFTRDLLSGDWLTVDEIDAINYMVSGVFGFATIPVTCSHCGFPHLDRDWFAVHLHRRHQCHGCGRQFSDHVPGVGNPLASLRDHFETKPRREVTAPRSIALVQKDYPGGIQIWGSNPAIVWTSDKPEEAGIHVHALATEGQERPDVDDTYARVTIDGVALDADQVRHYMAQSAMPHLAGRVTALSCPKCAAPHFDQGTFAFTPHVDHECDQCGVQFQAKQQIKKTISNPFVATRLALAEFTDRTLRNDPLGLRPETI
jgi:transposase-like protein